MAILKLKIKGTDHDANGIPSSKESAGAGPKVILLDMFFVSYSALV